jgi:hypothetical protein
MAETAQATARLLKSGAGKWLEESPSRTPLIFVIAYTLRNYIVEFIYTYIHPQTAGQGKRPSHLPFMNSVARVGKWPRVPCDGG